MTPLDRRLFKIEIKNNSEHARHIRLEEGKTLWNARMYKITGDREEEKSPENEEDHEKSEAFYNTYQNLRHRRVHELRKKQRNTFLAYGFLRGREYEEMEETRYSSPDWNEVEKIVFKFIDTDVYDPRAIKQQFEEWKQLATGVTL